jgi:cytochrome c-550 PedF
MRTVPTYAGGALIALGLIFSASVVFGHGDVQPQPVDTTGLEQLGTEWRDANPYRGNARAIEIGSSGYGQNCARCHGLQVISGGLAPDLRYLEKGQEGDTWFQERVRHGAIINGVTKMPVFDGVLSQEALWAIRSYLESKHED